MVFCNFSRLCCIELLALNCSLRGLSEPTALCDHGPAESHEIHKTGPIMWRRLGEFAAMTWCSIAERGSVMPTAATKKLSRRQDTSLLSAFCFFHLSTTGRFIGSTVQKWKTPTIPHSQSTSHHKCIKLKLLM